MTALPPDPKAVLLATLERRSKRYHCMLWRGAFLVGRDNREATPIAMTFMALKKGEPEPEAERHLYGNFLFVRSAMSVDDFQAVANGLGREPCRFPWPVNVTTSLGGGIPYSQNLDVEIPKGLFRYQGDDQAEHDRLMEVLGHSGPLAEGQVSLLRHSRSYPDSTSRRWPTQTFLYGFNMEALGSLFMRRHEPLPVSPDNPLVPTLQDALAWWFDGTAEYDEGFIRVHLPSYCARIREVTRGRGRLLVQVETAETSPLVLRCFSRYAEGRALTDIVQLRTDLRGEVRIPENAERTYFALTAADGTIQLDYRDYDWTRWGHTGLDYAVDPEDIELRIQQGEDETTELKLTFSGDGAEFLETISAFANTIGGVVVLGVDRNGNIKGLTDEQSQYLYDRALTLVRERIDPHLEVKADKVGVGGKQLVVVTVAKGSTPPYVYRDKGVYVRCGSTDRIASRAEYDRMRR